jgi:hypothetical protein
MLWQKPLLNNNRNEQIFGLRTFDLLSVGQLVAASLPLAALVLGSSLLEFSIRDDGFKPSGNLNQTIL